MFLKQVLFVCGVAAVHSVLSTVHGTDTIFTKLRVLLDIIFITFNLLNVKFLFRGFNGSGVMRCRVVVTFSDRGGMMLGRNAR